MPETTSAPAFSVEEQAVLDSAGSTARKKIFALIWGVKLRLQFTGWLQYIPFAIAALVLFLAAGLSGLAGLPQLAAGLGSIGALVSMILVFDLATVKYHLHPPERLPRRNDDLDLFELMRARRSCRSFQDRLLTPADHAELMESARQALASPAIGNAPIRFEYVAAPLTVWPVVNAREFLVAIVPAEYDRFAVIEVGRSLQKVVMDATRMGLGTCWIGPGADRTSIQHHLGDRFIPEKDHIICVTAVGYKSRYVPLFLRIFNRQFRRRLPLSALFFADPGFENPLDVEAPPFNQFGRSFEICQWAPSSYNGQTTRCIGIETDNGRAARFDFHSATASRYYAPVALGIWCANWEMGCRALGIPGNFAVLSPEERGIRAGIEHPALPRYDMSWMPEDRI